MNDGSYMGQVLWRTAHEFDLRAQIVRLTRHLAVFELYTPGVVLQASEVLKDFRIVIGERTAYSGRAVVRNLINSGLTLICEVTLDDKWLDPAGFAAGIDAKDFQAGFNSFLRSWGEVYRVDTDFKIIVADLQIFLGDLRLWLDQADMGIRSSSPGEHAELERTTMTHVDKHVIPAINELHRRFESICDRIDEPSRPAHQTFSRRQLHAYFLCSPFGARAYQKPLGYAGDYEMVRMICREPYEGDSLFAKTMNLWLLRQYPSEAHRNRIQYLKERLVEETLRLHTVGRRARILSLGCGPADEVEKFIRASPLSGNAEFTLIDFNDETIEYVRRTLEGAARDSARRPGLRFQKKSVLQILKEAVKSPSAGEVGQYDLIYCAGLFDYLTDRTCRQLLGVFHDWAAADGLVLVTNVNACKPFRHMLEFLLDWHIIYRTPRQMQALVPDHAVNDSPTVKCDATGVNLWFEWRRSAGR